MVERNFASPNRFRQPKSKETLDWETFKEVSKQPLRRMSRRVSGSLNGRRRLGTRLV